MGLFARLLGRPKPPPEPNSEVREYDSSFFEQRLSPETHRLVDDELETSEETHRLVDSDGELSPETYRAVDED